MSLPQPASDTLPDAQTVRVSVHRRMTGERRLLLACTMSDEARSLTLAGLRWAHPESSDEEIARMERRFRLGTALADAAWPPVRGLTP